MSTGKFVFNTTGSTGVVVVMSEKRETLGGLAAIVGRLLVRNS